MSQTLDEYRDSLEMSDQGPYSDEVDAPLPQQSSVQQASFIQPKWVNNYQTSGRKVVQTIWILIRPRLTFSYVCCALVLLYVAYCWVRNSPLLASRLPTYSGPYKVGTIDLEVPVSEKRNVSNVVYKDTGSPAFELDTVLFSIFYPAEDTKAQASAPHHWISKPISAVAAGYARAANFDNFVMRSVLSFSLWLIAGGITIPASVDLPLVSSTHRGSQKDLPVVVFSHGTASSRTDYTHFCGEMASQGIIVAALEHRDGSGPASLIMTENRRESHQVMYMRPSDLVSGEAIDVESFKEHQLAFREAEINEAIRILGIINGASHEDIRTMNRRDEGAHLKRWAGRLDFEQLIIAGHSYGATGALQALNPATRSKSIKAAGGIIFDPGKSSGQLNDDIDVPVLVVHSNSWSAAITVFFGRPHFDTVYDLVKKVLQRTGASWFVTSLGTSHPSVTDAPLIEPLLLSWTTGATINTKQGVNEYAKIAIDFIDYLANGKRTGVLAQPITHPAYNKDERTEKEKQDQPADIRDYWQIHVAPPSPA